MKESPRRFHPADDPANPLLRPICFAEFWDAAPIKSHRPQALDAWLEADPDYATGRQIVDGIRQLSEECGWDAGAEDAPAYPADLLDRYREWLGQIRIVPLGDVGQMAEWLAWRIDSRLSARQTCAGSCERMAREEDHALGLTDRAVELWTPERIATACGLKIVEDDLDGDREIIKGLRIISRSSYPTTVRDVISDADLGAEAVDPDALLDALSMAARTAGARWKAEQEEKAAARAGKTHISASEAVSTPSEGQSTAKTAVVDPDAVSGALATAEEPESDPFADDESAVF